MAESRGERRSGDSITGWSELALGSNEHRRRFSCCWNECTADDDADDDNGVSLELRI